MMGSEHPRPEPADTWRQQAACRNVNPNLMFPGDWDTNGIENAKAICRTCPSQTGCLNYAITTRQDHGIWGGTTEAERVAVRRRRARADRAAGIPPAPRQPKPINHGTDGGYRAHLRRKEKPCDSCKKAHDIAGAEYRANNPDRRNTDPAALSWSARRVLATLTNNGPQHATDLHAQVLAGLTARKLVTVDADGMAHATDEARQVAS